MATSNSTRGFYESNEWQELRLAKLNDTRGRCENCSCLSPRNQVHHVKPVRMFPQLALDFGNLKVLCRGCHEALHIVCRSRALTRMINDYSDPTFLTARRLDFGPVPLQFALPLDAAAANEEAFASNQQLPQSG